LHLLDLTCMSLKRDKFSSSRTRSWWECGDTLGFGEAASGAMAPLSYRVMISTTALLVAAVTGSPIDDSALGLCEVAWHTEPSHVSSSHHSNRLAAPLAAPAPLHGQPLTMGNWPLFVRALAVVLQQCSNHSQHHSQAQTCARLMPSCMACCWLVQAMRV